MERVLAELLSDALQAIASSINRLAAAVENSAGAPCGPCAGLGRISGNDLCAPCEGTGWKRPPPVHEVDIE